MNAADKNRATQQIQICVGENAFHFINVLVRETDFLQRFHSMLNVQQQTQFSNPNRRIVECQRKFCGIFCNFLQIVQTRFQKIILKDGKELLLLINSEITREKWLVIGARLNQCISRCLRTSIVVRIPEGFLHATWKCHQPKWTRTPSASNGLQVSPFSSSSISLMCPRSQSKLTQNTFHMKHF